MSNGARKQGRTSERMVLYVYGISRKPADVQGIAGVNGKAAVEPVECHGLLAWVSRVSDTEFGSGLTRNMENLDWLAEAGVRHQRVVAHLHGQVPVLPSRFGVVYLALRSLRAEVEMNLRPLQQKLRRVAGSDEWGVKVFRRARATAAVAGATSGREYLQQKAKALKPPRGSADPALAKFAQQLEAASRASASAAAVSTAQDGLEWQRSFLVQRNEHARWNEVLLRYARQWSDTREIECSGPWPPYSFV